MILKIEQDHSRFKQIVRGKIKQELRKFISQGELIGKQGNKYISIPLPQIDIPHFRFSDKQMGGVGSGEGAIGTVVSPGDEEEGEGNPKAGNAPGPHILEVDITLEEMAELLGEELALPKLEPKKSTKFSETRTVYRGIRPSGPNSLRHFKRTYKQALKRQLLSGHYNLSKPVIIPYGEDKRYRSGKPVREQQNAAVIIYMMDVSGCHTEGHFVEMADGSYKDVKDISEGDKICCVDIKSHRKEEGKVTKKFSFTADEVLEIQTEDHEALRVTPQHRYFIYNEKNGIEEKMACDLSPGDSLILFNQFGKGAIKKETSLINKTQAYLLGAMLGDGHIVDRLDPNDSQRNSRYIAITDEDENRLRYYSDCATTAFGVRGIIKETAEGRKRLHLNSFELVKWVKTHFPSIANRSRARSIDPILFTQSPEVRAAFIRGFFDAEGTLAKHAVEFISSSIKLAKQFKLLLSYWGIRARVQKYIQKDRVIGGQRLKEGIFHRVTLNSKDALLFQKFIGFQCRSKNKKLEGLCEQQSEGINAMRSRYISPWNLQEICCDIPSLGKIKSRLYEKERSCFSQANLQRMMAALTSDESKEKIRETLEKSMLLCRINKITKLDALQERVYDFEVTPHHNYIVDGVLSHNSMGQEQKEIVRIESFWIDTWLKSQYKGLETRYIIHDAVAREVDAETFYHTRESGGTIISSAYKLALKMIEEDYDPSQWNIYPFHFSDGDNWSGNDTMECLNLMEKEFFKISNVFCYGQVESEYGSGQFLKDLRDRFGEANEHLLTSKIEGKDKIIDSIKTFLGKGK